MCTYMHIHENKSVSMFDSIYIYICKYICAYIYIYTYDYICVKINIHTYVYASHDRYTV